ncbi:MAG: sulfite exporter TauE/SafE family protein [Gammaproteobacteria bacterium]|nr:sulfite exporter TauE/SafE family protein [Gammaproteobacteria bacterium]
MDLWTVYLSAFVVGLLGGVHCVGMCGGIVSALTFSLAENHRRTAAAMLPFQLAYNLGRMTSYLLAGAVMGGLGMLLAQLLPVYYAQFFLLVLAGIFMILLGLYLGGWWMLLNRLERAGARLWRCLEPLGRRLMPVSSPYRAFTVGVIWGWIPCGLVYSMLVNAIATGGALQGAGLMLAFALGTMPNLLLIGMLAGAAARLAQSVVARRVAGGIVVLFGMHTLWQAM